MPEPKDNPHKKNANLKSCKDFDNPITDQSGWEHATLYHATVDKNGVCNNGLYPRCQSPRCGLGTGTQTQNLVSFTFKEDIAKNIAKDLKTMIKIANGEITSDNICQQLDKIDTISSEKINPCSIWTNLVKSPSNRSLPSSQLEINENWEMLKKGYIKVDAEDLGFPKYIPIEKLKDQYPDYQIPIYYQLRKEYTNEMRNVFIKGTKPQQQQFLFEIWRRYLMNRESDLHIPNPVFTEDVKIDRVSDLNVDDVGVISVDAIIPNKDIIKYKRDVDDQLKMGFQYFGADEFNEEIRLDRKYFTKLRIIE